MNKEKVINSKKIKVNMPKAIKIGDPFYFESYNDDKNKLNKLTYSRGFRGKDLWIGEIIIEHKEITYEDMKFEDVVYKMIFAPSKEYLETYEEGCKYSTQKVKAIELGVDTAGYYIQVNKNSEIICTGSDGYFGDVYEIYRGTKIEGLIIEMRVGDYISCSELENTLRYLFDVQEEV